MNLINGLNTSSLIDSDQLVPTAAQHEDSSPSVNSSLLFAIDPCSMDPQSAGTLTYQLHAPLCISEIYRQHFFDYFHINYHGELKCEGLFIASIRCFPPKTQFDDSRNISSVLSDMNHQSHDQLVRAIIRTQARNYDVLELVSSLTEDNILQVLFGKIQLSTIRHYELIGDIKANEKILEFDKHNDESQQSKVGFIYQRSGQTTESELLSNDTMSNEMQNFLELIADRIHLQGFDKYRGDLDTNNNQHGDHSYYTVFENHHIMFNIAPMIPSEKTDSQFIQRKSLVGNALVCVVFQEPDAEFRPDSISGKVTQVYITVQPIVIDDLLYYKVQIWHCFGKTTVVNPLGGVYKHDQAFRDYFLTLILNTINLVFETPYFRSRILEHRQQLKLEELKKLCDIFSSHPELNLSYSDGSFTDLTDNHSQDNNTTPLPTIDSTSTATDVDPKPSAIKKHRLSFVSKIFSPLKINRSNFAPSASNMTVVNGLPSKSTTSTMPLPSNTKDVKPTPFEKSNDAPLPSTPTVLDPVHEQQDLPLIQPPSPVIESFGINGFADIPTSPTDKTPTSSATDNSIMVQNE